MKYIQNSKIIILNVENNKAIKLLLDHKESLRYWRLNLPIEKWLCKLTVEGPFSKRHISGFWLSLIDSSSIQRSFFLRLFGLNIKLICLTSAKSGSIFPLSQDAEHFFEKLKKQSKNTRGMKIIIWKMVDCRQVQCFKSKWVAIYEKVILAPCIWYVPLRFG